MSVASLQFLGLALIVAVVYRLRRTIWWHRTVFFAANLCFLSSFSLGPFSYVPLCGFVGAGYLALRVLQSGRSPRVFWTLLAAVISMFFWLKKYSFVPAVLFIDRIYVTIGLSYIFFRVVHLIIDAHGGHLPRRINVMCYLNYLFNFTTLVSGPIQRFEDFAAQENALGQRLTWRVAGHALERVILGFFKVVVVAPLLLTAHEQSLAILSAQSRFGTWLALWLCITTSYTFYLYFNFSGYIDIVISAARFIGLELPENFNRPFTSNNFLGFWARWHITLSDWLKTYVYNPLAKVLMQRFPNPSLEPWIGVGAYFVTFFLVGLWHGQTAVFAIFGVLQGLGVAGNKLYQIAVVKLLGRKRYRDLTAITLYRMLARGLTFAWFAMSLICFWGSWRDINSLSRGFGAVGVAALFLLLVMAASIVLPVADAVEKVVLSIGGEKRPVVLSRYVRTVQATAFATVIIGTMMLLNMSAPDIVYKNF
jgi:alginate O-acetyltransferase complex protein AlgI